MMDSMQFHAFPRCSCRYQNARPAAIEATLQRASRAAERSAPLTPVEEYQRVKVSSSTPAPSFRRTSSASQKKGASATRPHYLPDASAPHSTMVGLFMAK